jgi:hypothetical protein
MDHHCDADCTCRDDVNHSLTGHPTAPGNR